MGNKSLVWYRPTDQWQQTVLQLSWFICTLGKPGHALRSCPPLITHTASTNHAYILYSETFAHHVLTHTSMHTDTHALSAMRNYDTDAYLWVYILNTRQRLLISGASENGLQTVTAHVCVMSCLLYKHKRAALSLRTSWLTWLPIIADECPAPSDWQADSRYLHPASAGPPSPTDSNRKGLL